MFFQWFYSVFYLFDVASRLGDLGERAGDGTLRLALLFFEPGEDFKLVHRGLDEILNPPHVLFEPGK